MPTTTYSLAGKVDRLVERLSFVFSEAYADSPAQLRSDLDVFQLAVGFLSGFVASLAANQFPTIVERSRKPQLSREDLYELKDLLESASFTVDLKYVGPRYRDGLAGVLPASLPNREALVEKAIDEIMRELG